MKETENPVSEIKREIEKVKASAQQYNPAQEIEDALADRDKKSLAENGEKPEVHPAEDETYEGPVSR